nr:hypothetical protein [Actinomycetota bacterium]
PPDPAPAGGPLRSRTCPRPHLTPAARAERLVLTGAALSAAALAAADPVLDIALGAGGAGLLLMALGGLGLYLTRRRQ